MDTFPRVIIPRIGFVASWKREGLRRTSGYPPGSSSVTRTATAILSLQWCVSIAVRRIYDVVVAGGSSPEVPGRRCPTACLRALSSSVRNTQCRMDYRAHVHGRQKQSEARVWNRAVATGSRPAGAPRTENERHEQRGRYDATVSTLWNSH